jgi:hypothetical protein
MAYQKVVKKKKYWETPELIAAKAEAVRLHKSLKLSTVEIGNKIGKKPTQIWRWLKAEKVFQPAIPKQTAAKQKLSIASAHEAMRMEYKREVAALKTIDRHCRVHLCKECGTVFKPTIGIQGFCSQSCRTKSYLKLNRKVLAEKAKKKSDLFHKTRAERLYAAKNPKCVFCQNPIPFSKFFEMNSVKYCSQKCNQKAQSEKRKNDPIRAAAYKIIKAKTYLKRKLNGKNRLEKREYFRNNDSARIAKNLRSRLRLAIKKQGGKKSASTLELIGTDWPTFFTWIQSKFRPGMTWKNHGKWHIHHDIACARFDLTKPEQQRECFHFTNLLPMWGSENIKRGAKIFPTQLPFRF